MHGLCLRRAIPASIVCLAIVYIQWALSICLWVQWNIKISIRNLSVKWLQNLYPCCETSGSMYCLHVQLFLNIGIQSTTQMWQKDEHTRVGPEHAFVYSWLSLIPRQKDPMCMRLTYSGTDCASDMCTYQRRRKTLEIGVGHMTTTTQGWVLLLASVDLTRPHCLSAAYTYFQLTFCSQRTLQTQMLVWLTPVLLPRS